MRSPFASQRPSSVSAMPLPCTMPQIRFFRSVHYVVLMDFSAYDPAGQTPQGRAMHSARSPLKPMDFNAPQALAEPEALDQGI